MQKAVTTTTSSLLEIGEPCIPLAASCDDPTVVMEISRDCGAGCNLSSLRILIPAFDGTGLLVPTVAIPVTSGIVEPVESCSKGGDGRTTWAVCVCVFPDVGFCGGVDVAFAFMKLTAH